MANEAQKTEHSGPKKGRGAYWGRKKAAKKESNRVRREMDKSEEKPKSEEEIGEMMRKPAGVASCPRKSSCWVYCKWQDLSTRIRKTTSHRIDGNRWKAICNHGLT